MKITVEKDIEIGKEYEGELHAEAYEELGGGGDALVGAIYEEWNLGKGKDHVTHPFHLDIEFDDVAQLLDAMIETAADCNVRPEYTPENINDKIPVRDGLPLANDPRSSTASQYREIKEAWEEKLRPFRDLVALLKAREPC